MTLALPPLVYAFNLLCNDISGCPAPSLLHPSTFTLDKLKQDIGWKGVETIFNWESVAAALGWYALSIACYAILPAEVIDGTELYSGGRLKYRLNGK
jgi:delta14-sterol reductase